MAEKVTSMRLSEDDLEVFKAFAKENDLNQQQAFNTLISLAELEKAKGVLGDRAKSIDTFRDTINKAIGMYVNSLEENTTAEQTIREELSKELQTKDDTISNLYEQLKECKAAQNYIVDENEKLASRVKELQEQKYKSEKDIIDKQSQLDIANRNNNNLQEQVAEYKQYKEQYKELEQELGKVKVDNEKLETNKTLLETTIVKLKDKITNDTEILDFYKSNNAELKDSIKVLEQQHKQELQDTKVEHEKVLEKELKSNTDQLQSKNDVEVAKKDLEIQKLQNEIEQLKAKSHRPVKNNTTK